METILPVIKSRKYKKRKQQDHFLFYFAFKEQEMFQKPASRFCLFPSCFFDVIQPEPFSACIRSFFLHHGLTSSYVIWSTEQRPRWPASGDQQQGSDDVLKFLLKFCNCLHIFLNLTSVYGWFDIFLWRNYTYEEEIDSELNIQVYQKDTERKGCGWSTHIVLCTVLCIVWV